MDKSREGPSIQERQRLAYFTVEGQSSNADDMDESLGLSLLLLGEALSCTKNKIITQGSLTIRGWHSEAHEGWGSSIAVTKGMVEKGWCPKSVYVLRNQLQGNTTALHEAYMVRRPKQRSSHESCTETTCAARTVAGGAKYKQRHRCASGDCGSEGPNVADLVDVIRKGQFPVLELKDDLTITVRAHEPKEDYGTITHVWSDGFGNPLRNEMPRCQLEFLAEAITESERHLKMRNHGRKLFWIDTMAIPVGAENKPERKTSIGQIHDIFINSKYTIVFDSELCAMKVGNRYVETAINILASGWMQRLWTLQEAYLSKRLFFKFQDTALDLENLEELFPQAKGNSSSILPDAARGYFHSIMGTAREARIHQMTPRDGVSLIASIWKAAYWRTTSKKQHEAVAIATLLGLNSGSSTMASFLNDAFVTGDGEFNTAKYHESMKHLWALIHDVYPGSIPAGVIFLPPPRLSMDGFGWAPVSWLAGKDSDDLKPLFAQNPPTQLDQNGLLVEFPGFLLHCSSAARSQLQLLSEGKSELCFPYGSNLLEWYQVRKLFGDEEKDITLRSDETTDYAIIIPQEQPSIIEDVGLFVEIRRTQLQRSLENSRTTRIFHVSSLFRVLVRRDMGDNIEENKEQFFLDTDLILGELVDRSQKCDLCHYSQAVVLGNIVKCSGQGGWDKTGALDANDIPRQVELAFENVDRVLQAAGLRGWEDVYSVRSYHVVDIGLSYDKTVEMLKKRIPGHRPIWTAIAVPALAFPQMKIEIEVEAYVAEK
ncbi:Het domain protein [Lasiodiplodia theobromae]|uniref:Het domain protein n=1 Tax=Lasiodiplodia theobromae TaxID=45133 RepID=UPI0015C35525|nr:Het domain protein [Lasiodiplodia theobromae]KAF4546197.1 Het domain protein [Lasiodiplodia theobromae]